jgi:hypothetical protein
MLLLHLVFLFLFRRYPRMLGALDDTFFPAAVAAFVIVLLRLRSRSAIAERHRIRERWRPGLWLENLDGPKAALIGCFLGLFFTLHEYGGGVGNDGVILFSYVRSLTIDGDLDLRNEFDEFIPEKFRPLQPSAGALPRPPFEIGPALFWLPLYGLTHAAVKISAELGGSIPANGYSHPYVRAVCLASLIWSFVGVVLSYLIARSSFAPGLAAFGAIVLWLSSPLLWYTIYEPSMAHAVSLAAVALFLTAWLGARDRGGWRSWGAVGLAAGVMLSVQRYNLFYLVLPAVTLLGRARVHLWREKRIDAAAAIRAATAFGVGLLVSTAPLWLYQLALGASVVDGQEPSLALRLWQRGSLVEFLFSSKQGLFSWTPAAYLAVLGLVYRFSRRDFLAASFLLTLGLGAFVLSTKWDEGYSFGSRRLTEAFPIFLFGFCGFLEWARRSPRALTAAVCAALAIWNVLLVGQVHRGEIPAMNTFAFSDAAGRAVTRLYSEVGHPFAIPANWVFAWAYGVPPDRFDSIWGHRPYHDWTLEVGSSSDEHHLGRGWSVRERSPAGKTFRWSEGDQSSWLVHLYGPFHYRLRVEGEPARSPDGEPQVVVVQINGRGAGAMSFSDGASVQEILIPPPFWRAGLNEIAFRYRYTVRADETYGGADPRLIALRLERLELLIEDVPQSSSKAR